MRCFSWPCTTCITYSSYIGFSWFFKPFRAFQVTAFEGYYQCCWPLFRLRQAVCIAFLLSTSKVDRKRYLPDTYFPKHLHPLNRQHVSTSREKQTLQPNSTWNEQAELQPEREVSFQHKNVVWPACWWIYIYKYYDIQIWCKTHRTSSLSKDYNKFNTCPSLWWNFVSFKTLESQHLNTSRITERPGKLTLSPYFKNRHHRNGPPEWYHYDIMSRL